MKGIPNDQLRLSDIPANNANLRELVHFAHTFNGYEALGSFEACAHVANAQDHSSLIHVRACLFFEVRRWRHFGEDPGLEVLDYWRELAAKIRTFVDQHEQ